MCVCFGSVMQQDYSVVLLYMAEEQKETARHAQPAQEEENPQVANLSKPKKRAKKTKENPFEALNFISQQNGQAPPQSQWIKPKTTPLTIDIVDHSRVNKYYSHKSLQKYIRYLYAKTCPNPLWLSIKRQSQVDRIILIDLEIERAVFHRHFKTPASKQGEKQVQQGQGDCVLKFLSQYNTPTKRAIFKETTLLRQSCDLWQALFCYDEEATKSENILVCNPNIQLPKELTGDLLKLYETYTLSEDQRKFNLYPMASLPAYAEYYQVKGKKDIELRNKILVVDCEMVMSGTSFELARTTIINFQGELVYDQFFRPESPITNYNTQYSGITEATLANVTKRIKDLHQDMEKIIDEETILVGHSLQNDLHAMKMIHNRAIDTSVLFARRNGSKMKLKTLSHLLLQRQIQNGSHCSEQDCQATLDIMRQKIEASCAALPERKDYHLLNELIEAQKKIVIVDPHLEFIKHRQQFLGIEFEQVEFSSADPGPFVSRMLKHLDKNVRNPDLIFARIRRQDPQQQWEDYYRAVDGAAQAIYQGSPDKTVLMLNCQVNNSVEVYPQDPELTPESRRPFCLFIVKSQ